MKRIIDLQYKGTNQHMSQLFFVGGYIPHYADKDTIIIMDMNRNVIIFDLNSQQFYWENNPNNKFYINDYWNIEYDTSEMTEKTVKMLNSTYRNV